MAGEGGAATRGGVAVVVVHYGDPATTRVCLDDLARLDRRDLLPVVVDNDPAGAVAAEVERERPGWVALAPGSNLGYCRAVNLGLERALAAGVEYVLLLNNDVTFDEDFLSPLVAALAADDRAGAAGPLILDPAGRIWCTGGDFRFGPNVTRLRGQGAAYGRRWSTPAEVDYYPGACVLHRAAALRETGTLEESYWMYMEDLDLAVRQKARGWRTLYVPWSRVVHAPSSATGGGVSPRRKYYTALNSVHFLRRHGTPGRWLNFWLCDVAALPAAALVWLLKGEGPAPALAKLRGLVHGLAGRRAGEEGAG